MFPTVSVLVILCVFRWISSNCEEASSLVVTDSWWERVHEEQLGPQRGFKHWCIAGRRHFQVTTSSTITSKNRMQSSVFESFSWLVLSLFQTHLMETCSSCGGPHFGTSGVSDWPGPKHGSLAWQKLLWGSEEIVVGYLWQWKTGGNLTPRNGLQVSGSHMFFII